MSTATLSNPPIQPAQVSDLRIRRMLVGFFTAIIIGSLALLWWFVGDLAIRDYRIAKYYQQAECTILELRMDPLIPTKSFGFFSKRRKGSARPIFTYRFQVAGQEIIAGRYDSFDGRDATSQEYSRFRVGEKFPCWYDPEDPTQAVLVNTWRPERYWGAAIPLGFIFIAGIFLKGIGPAPQAPRGMPIRNFSTEKPHARISRGHILIGFAVILLISLTIVVPILAHKKQREAWPAQGAARHDGPELIAAIGLPPGAVETGFQSMQSSPDRLNAWDPQAYHIRWKRQYQSAADFPAIAEWYGDRLRQKGWSTHEAASGTTAAFCKNPWRLSLNRTADRGYALALEWNQSNSPCTHL